MTVLNLSSLMGLCFLTGKAEDQRPVRVLWNTAFFAVAYPFSCPTLGCCLYLLCEGTRYKNVPAPLHNVHIQSRLITGFFPLAVRSCFPIEGVDFIKGNDIDGGKIYPVPEVVDSPILQSEPDDLV